MKKLLSGWLLSLTLITSFAQVDTSFVYNTNMPYGTLDIRIAKSATRYYYLQENVTFSYRESAPGVRTNTFLDMTEWDSSPYTQGNLREKNGSLDNFVMNYRLLKPVGYRADYPQGYPLIVMFHGAGERANCWDNHCYHADRSYNPVSNEPAAPTAADSKLLNNDHSLLHGGKVLLDAVNLAGGMLPDNTSLPKRAFPGFVLFAQDLNGWETNAVQDALKIIRLVAKKYNIDENRIYIQGLSNGGHGAYDALKRAPWMFASGILMSAIDDAGISTLNLQSSISNIPLWVFQGALDENPTPNKTKNYVKRLQDAGAVVRYTEYPNLGHTTWNLSYKEPDFFTWMLGTNKSNISIFAGQATLCNSGGTGLPLRLPEGFRSYQWEANGKIIANANTATYMATASGTYRARFSRVANPTEAQWNTWSAPVTVTVQNPPTAAIKQIGTVILKDLNNNNEAVLEAGGDFAHYYWYKDGTLVDFPGTQDDTLKRISIKPVNCNGTCAANGVYTLSVANFDNCQSAQSPGKYVFLNDLAPVNITAPNNFSGKVASPSSTTLSWTDNSANENGFEIWRRSKISDTEFSPWEMVTLTNANITTFTDTGLAPSTSYYYKLRAVSNSGRSDYAPSAANEFLLVNTGEDKEKPTAPKNLTVKRAGLEAVKLSWKPATDNTAIKDYLIKYGTDSIRTGTADTTYRISGIKVNEYYTFQVKAVDLAGNVSAPSNSVNFNNVITGLYYEHGTGNWISLDSIDWSRPDYTGFVETFTLAPKTQADYFYFRFEGFINITTAGAYQFRTSSDDGSRLSLDGQLLINNDGVHDLKTVESAVQNLTDNEHRIRVDFFDYILTDSLLVEYKGPDTDNKWVELGKSELKSGNIVANEPDVQQDRTFTVDVYPNPTSQHAIFVKGESLNNIPVNIKFIDPLGRSVYAGELDMDALRNGFKLLPDGALKNGIYVIQASQGKQIIQRKVIIKE